jgi:predicted unusual protein kinase regulating ubiquinone biosynthesis (AarF/ABC1/UbiB family)
MDEVSGRPLHDYSMATRQVWKPRVLRAYRALRQAGVHHGDLHGGNILVNEASNRVYFIDFGSAVAYGRFKPGTQKLKAVAMAQGHQMTPNNIQMLVLFGGYQNLFNARGKRR